MSDILNTKTCQFFFGTLFRTDVAISAMSRHYDLGSLKEGLIASIEEGTAHMGIQLIGYQNVDTGLSAAILMRNQQSPSMISFFAESHHRLFGGHTLVCVPIAFCSTFYQTDGDYLVYRHTFKKPNYDQHEFDEIKRNGTPEQQIKAFAYTKSRDGYTTTSGMSYVGITKRSWQKRYLEHVESAMEKDSKTRFHEAIRHMQGQQVVQVHDISAYGITESAAKEYEIKLIKQSSLWPNGLNMKA
jgi:hypothetical protein